VFLRTSEEAAMERNSKFTYSEPSARIDDIDTSFDSDQGYHKVVVSGSGFDSKTKLIIDGIEQTLLS
jgi:hypothetical protein